MAYVVGGRWNAVNSGCILKMDPKKPAIPLSGEWVESEASNMMLELWPVWLSGLGVVPQRERSPVQFLIRAHA